MTVYHLPLDKHESRLTQTLKDYKTWVAMLLVAILLLSFFKITLELYTGHSRETEKAIAALESRIEHLELSKTPATMKRFTSDDALYLVACLKLPYTQREYCLDKIQSSLELKTK